MIPKIVYFLIILILTFIVFIGVRAAVMGIKAKKKINIPKNLTKIKKIKNYNWLKKSIEF